MFGSKRLIAVAAVAGLGLAGCASSAGSGTSSSTAGGAATGGSASSAAGGGPATGSVVLGSLTQPTSYAANGAGWANEALLQQAVYDTLLHAAPDGKILPWLATSWDLSADKLTLTLKLRTDVKFTDGTAFDADGAAKNLLRFREGTAPNKSFLAALKDAKAVDAGTLQLTLSQPDPAMLT